MHITGRETLANCDVAVCYECHWIKKKTYRGTAQKVKWLCYEMDALRIVRFPERKRDLSFHQGVHRLMVPPWRLINRCGWLCPWGRGNGECQYSADITNVRSYTSPTSYAFRHARRQITFHLHWPGHKVCPHRREQIPKRTPCSGTAGCVVFLKSPP